MTRQTLCRLTLLLATCAPAARAQEIVAVPGKPAGIYAVGEPM